MHSEVLWMVRDLTNGSPIRRILGFCLPLLIGALFQQLYSMTDSILVARYLGTEAFAAVGSTNSLNVLIIGFALGFCSGLCIPIARHFGERNVRLIRSTVANGLYLAAMVSLLIGVAMTLLTRPVLTLLGTPVNILDNACSYISVLFAGIGIIVSLNVCIGYMRALGDSRTPFIILVFCYLLNIILDLLFLAVFHMGVASAAWALIVSQFLSAFLCLRAISRRFPVLHFSRADAKISFPLIGSLCRLSVPLGLQFFISAIGSISLQVAVNSLGSDAIAAVSAGNKVQAVLLAPLETVGIAVAIFASQNLGANRPDRIRTGSRQILLFCGVYSVAAFGASHLFSSSLAELFLSSAEPKIHTMTQQFLNISAFFYVCTGVIYICRNTLQGLGRTNAIMFAGIPDMVGRMAVGILLVAPYGFYAACFGNPAAWTLTALVLIPMYVTAMRRLRKTHSLYTP